jgi:hypothetical protein
MTNVHIENGNNLNFLFKTAGNINHGYSPLKIFCRRSCHFFLLMGEKYSYHIRFVCAKRLGWWTLVIKKIQIITIFYQGTKITI